MWDEAARASGIGHRAVGHAGIRHEPIYAPSALPSAPVGRPPDRQESFSRLWPPRASVMRASDAGLRCGWSSVGVVSALLQGHDVALAILVNGPCGLMSFTLRSVSGPAAEVLRRTLSMYVKDYVEVQPSGAVFPSYLEDWCIKYHEFPVKKDDVWVVTYPKAGTTWTQELVWCLMFDMDSAEAKLELMKRFPFFEFDCLVDSSLEVPEMRPDDPMKPGNTWKILQTFKSPRTIKSHLPVALLPKQLWNVHPKIIYVCRDPRDVCVSYYFHCIKLEGYKGSFDEFVQIFLGDMITYSPIWPHILDFWRRRHQSNILFIRFEDMKEDLPAVVRKVAKFLGKEVTEEEAEEQD